MTFDPNAFTTWVQVAALLVLVLGIVMLKWLDTKAKLTNTRLAEVEEKLDKIEQNLERTGSDDQ